MRKSNQPATGKDQSKPGFTFTRSDKQDEAYTTFCTHLYTLYGGSRGPGKSWLLRNALLQWMLKRISEGVHPITVGLFCEDYPSLIDRQVTKIETEWPRGLGTVMDSRRHGFGFHLASGKGVIALRNLDKPEKFQSAEFAAIGVDELTKNPLPTFNILRGSLRWPGVKRCPFLGASNPGGIGMGWVKQYWIDRIFPPELQQIAHEFAFVKALPADNPHLDESYWTMLNTLPPVLAKAWRDGDWSAFEGQYFAWTDAHEIEPREIPHGAPLLMTYDWGFGKPFSVGWWYWDADGRLYRFGEWYGAARGQGDVGLRMGDPDVARGILEREEKMGISGRVARRLCDPTCFSKKPDTRGGGQGPSTAEEFAAEGVMLEPGDPSRHLGWRQMHARIALRRGADGMWTGELPMLVAFKDRCPAFCAQMRTLQADPNDLEDVDTRMEDHAADDAKLAVLSRPMVVAAVGAPTAMLPAGGVRVDEERGVL